MQCEIALIRTATSAGHHGSVSLMCVDRISELTTNSLFLTTEKIRLLSIGRGVVLPKTHSLAMVPSTIQYYHMSHKSCEDIISRQVKSDRCAQCVQLTWTFKAAGGPSTFKSSSSGVFSVLIPAAHRFFADITLGSHIPFQRCPFLRNEANGSGNRPKRQI